MYVGNWADARGFEETEGIAREGSYEGDEFGGASGEEYEVVFEPVVGREGCRGPGGAATEETETPCSRCCMDVDGVGRSETGDSATGEKYEEC